MKRAAGILILLLVALALDGCLSLMGPCAGYGCPAFAPKASAQGQPPTAQTAQQPSQHHHLVNPFSHKAQAQRDAVSAAKSGQ